MAQVQKIFSWYLVGPTPIAECRKKSAKGNRCVLVPGKSIREGGQHCWAEGVVLQGRLLDVSACETTKSWRFQNNWLQKLNKSYEVSFSIAAHCTYKDHLLCLVEFLTGIIFRRLVTLHKRWQASDHLLIGLRINSHGAKFEIHVQTSSRMASYDMSLKHLTSSFGHKICLGRLGERFSPSVCSFLTFSSLHASGVITKRIFIDWVIWHSTCSLHYRRCRVQHWIVRLLKEKKSYPPTQYQPHVPSQCTHKHTLSAYNARWAWEFAGICPGYAIFKLCLGML